MPTRRSDLNRNSLPPIYSVDELKKLEGVKITRKQTPAHIQRNGIITDIIFHDKFSKAVILWDDDEEVFYGENFGDRQIDCMVPCSTILISEIISGRNYIVTT